MNAEIERLWAVIVSERKRLDGASDGIGQAMTKDDQKALDKHIKELLEKRKALIAKRNALETKEEENKKKWEELNSKLQKIRENRTNLLAGINESYEMLRNFNEGIGQSMTHATYENIRETLIKMIDSSNEQAEQIKTIKDEMEKLEK